MQLTSDRNKKRRGQCPTSPQTVGQDTRTLLIQTAKTLFAAKGFDGTTVKDIADLAQVNISLISYHFQGKEGLYRTCLELFGKARLAVAERVLLNPQSAEELRIRLEMFAVEMLSAHIEEPELSRIVARECDMNTPVARDIFKNTFFKSFETLVNFFKSAQQHDIIRRDLDMNIVAGLVFGSLIQVGQKDHVNEYFLNRTIKDPKYLTEVVRNSLSFYLEGCLNRASQERVQNKTEKNVRKNSKKNGPHQGLHDKIIHEFKQERSRK